MMKKLKHDSNKNNNNFLGKNKYSFDKPPQIFIRRAVESEEETEGEDKPRAKYNDKRRKYK